MGPQTKFSHMSQLLRPAETGLFIFTKGDCFEIDKRKGSGYTGWWNVDLRRRVDWIFVYHKATEDCKKLYMARCGDLSGPNRDGLYLINLRDVKDVGRAETNWPDFGGGYGGGLRYFP